MKIHLFKSEEDWLSIRKGKATASQIHRLLAGSANELSKGAKTYCEEIFAETVADDVTPGYTDFAMEWGKSEEPNAILELDKLYPHDEIQHFGAWEFLFCEYNSFSGCSPDALCENKFGVEVKCPVKKEIHIERVMTVNSGTELLAYDKAIYTQIQFNMMCFGLNKWLWVSWYDGMRESALKLHVVEIEADPVMQGLIEKKLEQAAQYVAELRLVYDAVLKSKKA